MASDQIATIYNLKKCILLGKQVKTILYGKYVVGITVMYFSKLQLLTVKNVIINFFYLTQTQKLGDWEGGGDDSCQY